MGNSANTDYIVLQCRRRTFWVVYIIDKYLSVVFGRPSLWHDDDINQDYPECINDEDMSSQGPSPSPAALDCHVNSLISHAKYAILRSTQAKALTRTGFLKSSDIYPEKFIL